MIADELHMRHWIMTEAWFFWVIKKNKNKNKQLSSEHLLTLLVSPMSNVNMHQNVPGAKSESLSFAVTLRVLKEHTRITTTHPSLILPRSFTGGLTQRFHTLSPGIFTSVLATKFRTVAARIVSFLDRFSSACSPWRTWPLGDWKDVGTFL